jgi:hypothetical protein
MNTKPVAKYSVGDRVIADGDCAIIKQVIQPADSDRFSGKIAYGVEWPTDEWGTFTEDELEGIE